MQYLKFDFRNSQLRRKYDGLKYTLKNMETMLYELSLSRGGGKATKVGSTSAGNAAAAKKMEEGDGDH